MKTALLAAAFAAVAAALSGCIFTEEMEARVAAKTRPTVRTMARRPERAAICNAVCCCASSTSSRPLSLRRSRKRNSIRARQLAAGLRGGY